MQLTFRGSVNRWECDENDHLNVRFCEQKLYQAFLSGLLVQGVIRSSDVAGLPKYIRRQHIRFQAESRIGAPLSGYFAVIDDNEFQVLVELRNEVTGVVVCSMLCDFGDADIKARLLKTTSAMTTPEAIGHAWPRGIERNLDLHSLTLDQAQTLGFRTIGVGVIEPDECSTEALLLPHHCMGRLSDSMPHLWGAVFPESHASEDEGGAVVEFRRSYEGTLSAADPFQIVSGIIAVGQRVQSFAHLIFNLRTNKCCVNAQAVGLRMDLHARKAVTMDKHALAKLKAQLINLPNS